MIDSIVVPRHDHTLSLNNIIEGIRIQSGTKELLSLEKNENQQFRRPSPDCSHRIR